MYKFTINNVTITKVHFNYVYNGIKTKQETKPIYNINIKIYGRNISVTKLFYSRSNKVLQNEATKSWTMKKFQIKHCRKEKYIEFYTSSSKETKIITIKREEHFNLDCGDCLHIWAWQTGSLKDFFQREDGNRNSERNIQISNVENSFIKM